MVAVTALFHTTLGSSVAEGRMTDLIIHLCCASAALERCCIQHGSDLAKSVATYFFSGVPDQVLEPCVHVHYVQVVG